MSNNYDLFDNSQIQKLIEDVSNKRYKKKLREEPDDDWVNDKRFELIKTAFDRINEGMENKHYLQVICLCDSLMTDRFARILQKLREREDSSFPEQTLRETVVSLQWQLGEDGRTFGDDFDDHINLVAKKEPENLRRADPEIKKTFELSNWCSMRNVAVHEFVTVHNLSIKRTLEERFEWEENTATAGVILTNKTFSMSKKIMKNLYDDFNYGKQRVK